MTDPIDLPYPVPEPHEWVDEPDSETARLLDEAFDDLAAGRSVICPSEASFDALLAELAAEPHTRAS
ncbi:hypothetical protein MXD59_12390 [Frankia sp. Ag45/Mut15]|uniref:Uncharacterized protein n=1 Tax=Frankia umida TaxID=573489 RepID=A0ABT0JYP1_9ACTN|nr:hypothetical protein [Frankia umida]MCK9876565.1 hypothetical protein [Frankia umida]